MKWPQCSKDTAECVVRRRVEAIKRYQTRNEFGLHKIAELEQLEPTDTIKRYTDGLREEIEQNKASNRWELQDMASDVENTDLSIAATGALL